MSPLIGAEVSEPVVLEPWQTTAASGQNNQNGAAEGACHGKLHPPPRSWLATAEVQRKDTVMTYDLPPRDSHAQRAARARASSQLHF